MTTKRSARPAPEEHSHDVIPLAEAARAWFAISLQTFGGPAGQIAVMQRMLVEEKRWIGQQRFLFALSYCTLLPGPEAQQLATYVAGCSTAPRALSSRGSCSSCPVSQPCCSSPGSTSPTATPPSSKRSSSDWRRRSSRSCSKP